MTFDDIFFQDFPGPKWFSGTFQVLEFSRKKSRTFQEAWEPWLSLCVCVCVVCLCTALTTSQLLIGIGVVVALMFTALICVNVYLCRRLYRHHHHSQQQQQQQQLDQCSNGRLVTSVELMNSMSTLSHHYTAAPTAAAAAVDTNGSATDACRSSPSDFYKPLTTCTDADQPDDSEQHYEDIDIYLVPVTDHFYQNDRV